MQDGDYVGREARNAMIHERVGIVIHVIGHKVHERAGAVY